MQTVVYCDPRSISTTTPSQPSALFESSMQAAGKRVSETDRLRDVVTAGDSPQTRPCRRHSPCQQLGRAAAIQSYTLYVCMCDAASLSVYGLWGTPPRPCMYTVMCCILQPLHPCRLPGAEAGQSRCYGAIFKQSRLISCALLPARRLRPAVATLMHLA